MKKQMDMTQGSLVDKIFLFALPLAFTNILQQVFNAADVAVVGRFVGKTAMAAVGSNSAFVGLALNLLGGLALGSNVVISMYLGRRDRKQVRLAVHSSLLLAIASGLVLAILFEIFAHPLLVLLGVPDSVMPMSLLYMRIYLAGLPVITLYNFETAVFRSRGDTRTPLIILLVSGIMNVGLNLFFVLSLGMDVDGVAYATVISNAFSAVVLLVLLLRSDDVIGVRLSELKMDRARTLQTLRIGLPSGIQGSIFSISNLCIQSAINQLGPDVMAASSAAFNIEIALYLVLNAFGQTTTTFIGQNYGAGKLDRCGRITRDCILYGLLTCGALTAVVWIFLKPLLGLFTTDSTVMSYALIRLSLMMSTELLEMPMDGISYSLRGYGRSLEPAVVTLLGVCGVRIFWVYLIYPRFGTFFALLLCYPISWSVTIAGLLFIYRSALKKIRAAFSKNTVREAGR